MSTLDQDIRDYYFTHFDELPADKQFHFVSRLASWDNDKQATQLLEQLRNTFAPDDIKQILQDLIDSPPEAKINAAAIRAPYFEKYPQLRGYMLALFRVRHLLFHYNIDVRDTLLEIIPIDTLYALSEQLQQDTNALKVLSTYAINYIYLVESILFPRPTQYFPNFANKMLKLASTYGDTPQDSLLLIYLLTHCIIGESNFYQSTVRETPYLEMVQLIEQRIATHFNNINLDNKFEFLVCCRLVAYTTAIEEAVYREAAQSMSADGTYLIDALNSAGQANKTSFVDSEHRNVLFIMSNTPFIQAVSVVSHR